MVSSNRKSKRFAPNKEIEIIKREKVIEIIKEVPVPIKKYVDVHYDVIVDVPIERTIEREKIT